MKINTLRRIYFSFIAYLLLFTGIAYNKIQNQNNLVGDENLQTIAPAIGILLGVLGQILSRFMIKDFKPSLDKKSEYLKKYHFSKLIQWAGMEAGALMNITLYFTGGKSMNLYLGLVLTLGVIALFPSEKDLFKLFKISEKDLEEKPKVDDTF